MCVSLNCWLFEIRKKYVDFSAPLSWQLQVEILMNLILHKYKKKQRRRRFGCVMRVIYEMKDDSLRSVFNEKSHDNE
jgi:hypothetical protein